MRKVWPAVLGIWLAAAWTAAAPPAASRLPAEVVRYGGGALNLGARLSWALTEASKLEAGSRFWVGYSIRRLMGENEMVGSFSGGLGKIEVTIEEILAGKTKLGSRPGAGDDVRRTAREVLDDLERPKKPEKKVLKDLGIFLSYEAGRPAGLKDVDLSNLDLSFDFKERTLYWLGESGDEESLGLINDLFAKGDGRKAKEGLISAAGVHGEPRLAVPFLEKILKGDEADGLRKDAAFWIGQQDDAAGLRILVRAAETDHAKEVREGAVFAVSQVELPEAVDELISLARKAKLVDVRKQAVFWLGQIASEKSGPTLEEFATKDGDLSVQEQAVFALSQLPRNEGVEPLIKLAKTHPDLRIRKKAIFWLGECHDPRALEALIAIVKGK
jgi:HEAT repeat protein